MTTSFPLLAHDGATFAVVPSAQGCGTRKSLDMTLIAVVPSINNKHYSRGFLDELGQIHIPHPVSRAGADEVALRLSTSTLRCKCV